MKKLMFTFAMAAMAFTTVQAQKQLGGEHNFEVAFNPFGGNPINASTLKYRNFLDDDAALRISIGINNSLDSYLMAPENTLTGVSEQGSSVSLTHPDLVLTNQSQHLDFGVGYEKHFRGTDNLSPYLAFVAGYSSSTIRLKREHFSALNIEDAEFAGAWEDEKDVAQWGEWNYTNTVKSSEINLNLMLGADYYFSDALYIGFEAGLRMARNLGVTSTIATDNASAFNMYFDGGSGVGNDGDLVVNTASSGGYQWSSNTPVDYVINSEPWLDGGAASGSSSLAPQGAYIAADALWNDWSEQGPTNQDAVSDQARDALFAGSNFLGTYSTGMLRVGFLFE